MENIKSLGKLLFTNLFLNSAVLKSFSSSKPEKFDNPFSFLPNTHLYSRLLTSTHFFRLPQSEKDKYLFKDMQTPKTQIPLSDFSLYFAEYTSFLNEAHTRSCKYLGIPQSTVQLKDFSEDKQFNPNGFLTLDSATGEIFVNENKNFTLTRPSFLVEMINNATMQYGVFKNMIACVKNPEKVGDAEYFVSLTKAVEVYVTQEMARYNSKAELSTMQETDYCSPTNILANVFAFNKTREDFQSAGLYGGQLRDELRENEQNFYEDLSKEVLSESLIYVEDLLGYFNGTDLNQDSDGLMGKLFENLVNSTARTFYNSLGADMHEGETISQYIDRLEDDLFETMGIEKPDDETLQEYMEGKLQDEESDEDFDALDEGMPFDEEYTEDDEEQEDEGESSFEEEFMSDPHYPPMRNVMPKEGKVFPVDKLPFSSQDGFEELLK